MTRMRRTKPTITELAFFVSGVIVILTGWPADLNHRGGRCARPDLENRGSPDGTLPGLVDAIRTGRTPQDGAHYRGAKPVRLRFLRQPLSRGAGTPAPSLPRGSRKLAGTSR